MKSLLFSFLILQLSVVGAICQPSIDWSVTYGGSDYDEAFSIIQTSDEGYLVVGSTYSTDGDIGGLLGYLDIWVTKLSKTGQLEWEKTFGGSLVEEAYSICETQEGNYAIAGFTESNNWDVTGYHGSRDGWVFVINDEGNLLWQRSLGGTHLDQFYGIKATLDGGVIVVGESTSSDGDITNHHGSSDLWVVKLKKMGELEWQKSFGGSDYEVAHSVETTNDGGYIIGGETQSVDGDISDNDGFGDAWVLKLDSTGNIEWNKTYGGLAAERANEIHQTNEGGYIFIGLSRSNDGDVTNGHGGNDYWIVKLNLSGEIEWQRACGGSDEDYGESITQVSDGGYIATGDALSKSGDVTGNHGSRDQWIVKLSASGSLEWQKTYGGTKNDFAFCIRQTLDSGYVVAGHSWSSNGDVPLVDGYDDFWILKLSPESNAATEAQVQPLDISPNPATNSIRITVPTEETSIEVTLTDLMGRMVLQKEVASGVFVASDLDISALPAGMYMVKAVSPSGRVFAGKVEKR